MAILLTIVAVLAAASIMFFMTIVFSYMAILIKDEIKAYREEPRLTKKEKFQQEVEWENFIADLNEFHRNPAKTPLNRFRDGVNV